MSTTLVMSDELFDAQFVRALAYAEHGGAELGECVETARRITRTDVGLWYEQWSATAERLAGIARRSEAAAPSASARSAYFRASNYYRTAGLFLMGTPVDARLRSSSALQRETFRAGAALLPLPPEVLEIPYEGTTLPGYLFLAADDGTPRPTVILTNGYDGTVEELYFAHGAAALARGYHVLAFDGPGQGSVILDQEIPFRPDWENVVTPVVDFALTRPEIDPARLALIGWSFGGYTAPRAATAEHRLAACVSDCGPYDLYDATMAKVPALLAHQYADHRSIATTVLAKAMGSVMKKPTAGWALRRNLWVHGITDPAEFLELSSQYSLKGREHLITCPTFVSSTVGDDLSASAKTLADNLSCEHEHVVFGADDDVSGHCEMTGRAVFAERMHAWLAGVLA